MEPVVGIEPTTDGLQNRCSTAELNWHPNIANSILFISFGKPPIDYEAFASGRSESNCEQTQQPDVYKLTTADGQVGCIIERAKNQMGHTFPLDQLIEIPSLSNIFWKSVN